MADGLSSPIDLGLPDTPQLSKEVSLEIIEQFAAVFNAIKILRQAVDQYVGNGTLDLANYLSSINPNFSQSIQIQKLQAMVVTATAAISAGQFVNLFNSSGIKARLAQANALSARAHGWAPADIANGATGVIFLNSGYSNNFSGLATGSLYYLSNTTPGGITSARPITAGTISQEVGTALSATELLIKIQPYQEVN